MPLVAIVGRPNDEPGVTRDRIYGDAEWNGVEFDLVDTGGFVPRSADRFEAAIREQVQIALGEADAIVFVGDVLTGVTDLDEEMARVLRRTETPVLVVANKADSATRRLDAADFYSLGLGEVYPVSATNGIGTGELLDALVDALPDAPEKVEDTRTHISLIGKPNVGKSSLVNAILGFDRSIVTEVPGTTRDAIHSVVNYEGDELVLVDTAGLRKKAKVKENVEFYSTLRSERAIREGDVCVLLLDATVGLENQDTRVLKQAEEKQKGMVIAVNKWDLVPKDSKTAKRYEEYFRQMLETLDHVPIVFVSALTRQRVYRLLDVALKVAKERQKRIDTSTLNEVVQQAVEAHHPPTWRGNYVEIKYATQVETAPPVFVFFCNHPQGVKTSYKRYLENKLREAFGFEGVPLVLKFKPK
jgi:GTP-binding protein